MKFFMNKSIWSKIVIALVIVLVFQFIVTKPSLGASDDILEFGGKLIKPIISLVVTLADGVQEIMQSSIMGVGNSLLHIDTSSEWYSAFKWVIRVAVAAAVRSSNIYVRRCSCHSGSCGSCFYC